MVQNNFEAKWKLLQNRIAIIPTLRGWEEEQTQHGLEGWMLDRRGLEAISGISLKKWKSKKDQVNRAAIKVGISLWDDRSLLTVQNIACRIAQRKVPTFH